MKIKSSKSIRNYKNEIMIGTLDTWLMNRLFQRTSEQV